MNDLGICLEVVSSRSC